MFAKLSSIVPPTPWTAVCKYYILRICAAAGYRLPEDRNPVPKPEPDYNPNTYIECRPIRRLDQAFSDDVLVNLKPVTRAQCACRCNCAMWSSPPAHSTVSPRVATPLSRSNPTLSRTPSPTSLYFVRRQASGVDYVGTLVLLLLLPSTLLFPQRSHEGMIQPTYATSPRNATTKKKRGNNRTGFYGFHVICLYIFPLSLSSSLMQNVRAGRIKRYTPD